MPNNQKKQVLELWTTLKDKITALLSDLDSFKSNQGAVIERYEMNNLWLFHYMKY